MKLRFKIGMFFLCSLVAVAQKQKKVVFVIADGIPYDVIISQPMKNLKDLTKTGMLMESYVGGEKHGYSQTPTISAVGYNSLLTGTWANKHNVWDNENQAPNYNYETVFKLFKTQFPNKKTAIFSTWEDNRTILLGSSRKETGNFMPDYHFDGYELDTIQFPHDKGGEFYDKIDNLVIEKACAGIKENAPDLSWIYLEYTDEMGHQHGTSPEFTAAVQKLDLKIGKINEAIKYREKKFNEEWMVIITTDHGRDCSGYNHGEQTNRERNTWIATNYPGLNVYGKTQQPAIVDIAPTIWRFMDAKIANDQQFELDGVPMIGKVSAINAFAKIEKNELKITWSPIDDEGIAKIWIATTNNFKNGQKDQYKLVKEAKVDDWHTDIDITNMKSDFYKIVIEMPHNTLNRWVIVK